MRFRRTPSPSGVLLALVSSAIFLTASEVMVRGLGLDFILIKPILYYQGADLEVHRPSADIERLYEFVPGAAALLPGLEPNSPARRVTINALGMRDRPRQPRKKPGIFRIICVGDSNTYGAAVNDDQTYPAQLERLLNAGRAGRFEVWNWGVSAYVLRQKVAEARIALERYEPDLIIIQHINNGRRAFLRNTPFETYFQRDPSLWQEELGWIPMRGWALGRIFLEHWRLYRCLVIAANYFPASRRELPFDADPNNQANAAILRRFYREFHGRTPIILLSTPKSYLGDGLSNLGIDQIDLISRLPPGAPPEYLLVHPPARVYHWYAEVIASELGRLGLLPTPRRM